MKESIIGLNGGEWTAQHCFNMPDWYNWKANNPINSIDCVGFDVERWELLYIECNTSISVASEIGKQIFIN